MILYHLQRQYAKFCLAILGLLMLTAVVRAIDPIAAPDMTREERRIATDFFKGKIPASPEAAEALKKLIAGEMSRLTQPDVTKYADVRAAIMNAYLLPAKDQEARSVMNSTIASWAKGIAANGQFSPQSRINCVALLAELDDMPASGANPPQPSLIATDPLLAIAKDEKAPVYLRAIALYGLERQISVWWNSNKWPAATKSDMGRTLVAIANSEPQTALELKSHAWLVRRAYDCLGTIGLPVAVVVDPALKRIADPKTLPSLRLAAARYLSKVDSRTFTDDQKSLYVVGVSHVIRSQLVGWYEQEDDVIKRESGATGGMGGYGGMGGMGGYGGGGYGGEGGMGGMGGMGMEGGSDMGGYGGGMGGFGGEGYGGEGGYGGQTAKKKPIDTQTWQTLLSRRRVNEISQLVHVCLNGLPVKDGKAANLTGIPLAQAWTDADGKSTTVAGTPQAEAEAKVAELIELLETFQTAINDSEKITDINSLLTQAELPIEDIMDLVLEVPGFTEKYPDLIKGDELETVPEKPKGEAGDKTPPAGGNADEGDKAGGNPDGPAGGASGPGGGAGGPGGGAGGN